jgi:hypothetical protein
VLNFGYEVIIQRDDKWDPRRKKYFHPRFAIVSQGQEIKWTNHDTLSFLMEYLILEKF